MDGTGYFYLSYYDQTLQTPETLDFFTETYPSGVEYYIANQYDYLTSANIAKTESVDETLMANVFTADEDQAVRTVAVQTGTPNVTVEARVYLLDEGFASPTDGELVATASGQFAYGGFHRLELAQPVVVEAGQTLSVVVSERNPAGEYEVLMANAMNEQGSRYLIELGIAKYYSVGVVNEGESYLCEDGAWTDWCDVIDEMRVDDPSTADYDYDNFPIKAYADPVDAAAFSDVAEGDWFAEAVAYVADAGIMTGYEGDRAGEFGPLDAMERQDVAVMLYKYLAPDEYAQTCDPEVYGDSTNRTGLPDVESGAYYTPAVNWAYDHGYMTGYDGGPDAGTFGALDAISREQFATILYRALGGQDGSAGSEAGLLAASGGGGGSGFADADDVSAWAGEAMAWCIEAGIVQGENGMLHPQRDVTRAEAATMMMRADML